jgi:[acyl-carrier-protein] S-malonyltransferase
MSNPVRWAETVVALTRAGVQQVVECGPGSVLTMLGRRIVPDLKISAPKDANTLQELATGSTLQ